MISIILKPRFRYLSVFAIPLFFILAISCNDNKTIFKSYTEPTINQPVQTDDGWETATVTDVGMNTGPLLDLLNFLNVEPNHNVHSILIVKDGKLVFETYYPGHAFSYYNQNFHGKLIEFDRDTLQNTHSATKSITSICIGICRDQGYLQSIEETVFSFFPQYSHLSNPQKDQITVKNLLTMTSGLEWNEWDVAISNTQNDIYRIYIAPDPLAYVLAKPLVNPPGTTFYYNGGTTNVLGEIVRKCSGTRLDWLSRILLYQPLGITDFQWQYFPNGVVYASGDCYLRPRDMAKIGLLILQKGVWEGERILSEEWVNESTQMFISLPWLSWADGYGYQWWIKYYFSGISYIPVYFASGWGGQSIRIFPTLNIVAVFTGSNYASAHPIDYLISEYILPSVL
jgi:CubicO group peptidase (beta-lactamase class C family)